MNHAGYDDVKKRICLIMIVIIKKGGNCRSKLHDESRLIQRSVDDNKGDDKKLKGQEHFMITKMMISRIKE